MRKPDLTEFPQPTANDWALQASSALNNADPFKKLQWSYEPDVSVKPYFDKSLQPGEAVNLSLEKDPSTGAHGRQWHYLETIDTGDTKAGNSQALAALNGAEGILWNLTETHPLPDPAILFDGIRTEFCQNAFLIRKWEPDSTYFFSQLLSAGNTLSGFLWFDTVDPAKCTELLQLFEEAPLFQPLCFDAIPDHEKGLPPTAELSLLLSKFIEKAAFLTEKGFTPAQIVEKSVFCLGIGRDFFHGIAKIRALKILICKAASAFGAGEISPSDVSIFARPSIRNYSVTDPYVNIIRATTEAMAGIIGGAQYITVPGFDYFHRISPEGFSKRIGRNISNLLREESYLDKNADPSAGAYFIESLTGQLATTAWEKMQQAERIGGFSSALNNGLWERDRQAFVEEEQRRVSKRILNLIGVSKYNDLELFTDFPSAEYFRKTVEKTAVRPIGYDFELLRLRTEGYTKNSGSSRPEIVPLLFGDKSKALARSAFVQGFFPPAGFKVSALIWWDGSATSLKKETRALVLCSSDDDYLTTGQDVISQLQKDHPEMDIAIAGNPPEKEILLQQGITIFIHLNSDLLEVLTRYQKLFGIA